MEKLFEVLHQAWHALDDCEDRGEDGHVIMRADADNLQKAVESVLGEHPWETHPRLADVKTKLKIESDRMADIAIELDKHIKGSWLKTIPLGPSSLLTCRYCYAPAVKLRTDITHQPNCPTRLIP